MATSHSLVSAVLVLVQIIQQEEVQELGTTVASGVLQRLAARTLQILLRPDGRNAPGPAPTQVSAV